MYISESVCLHRDEPADWCFLDGGSGEKVSDRTCEWGQTPHVHCSIYLHMHHRKVRLKQLSLMTQWTVSVNPGRPLKHNSILTFSYLLFSSAALWLGFIPTLCRVMTESWSSVLPEEMEECAAASALSVWPQDSLHSFVHNTYGSETTLCAR